MTRSVRIAIAVLLAAILIRLALPFGIRAVLESQATAAIGRPVTVESVGLSLTRGAATVEGIRVGTEEGASLLCSRISANLHFLGLVTGAIRLESVEILEPEIAVRLLADGTLEPVLLTTDPTPEDPDAEPTAEPPEPEEPAPEVAGEAEESGGGMPIYIDQLALENLSVYLVAEGEGEGEAPAELALGLLSLQNFSIVEGDIDFGSIGIERPRVTLRRDLALAPATAAPAAPEPEAPSQAPPQGPGPSISGSDLTIEDAQFAIQVGEEEVAMTLNASVRDVQFGGEQRFPIELRLEREGGGVEFEGEAGTQPVALKGNLAIKGIPLANLLYIADPESPTRIERGLLGGKLALDVNVEPEGIRGAFDGGFSIEDLAVNASGRRIEAGSIRPRVSDLRISPGASGEPAITADVATLDIDGFGLRDETVDPFGLLELREIRVEAKGLRLPEKDLQLDVAIQGLGEAAGSAASRLAAGSGDTEIDLSGFPVEGFSGYARGAGFLLKSGRATLVGDIGSQATAHDANLNLSLERLEIETIDAGAFEKLFGMSPDLALTVLQDASGVVQLPLHFGLDTASGDTSVSLPQLLAGALRQAVMGVLTTPLKGLGFVARGVLGEGGELQMEAIAFEPGSSDWLEGEEDYIDAIARSIQARPGLGARLIGSALEDEARRPERLAEKRAKAISRALLEAGVDPAAVEIAPISLGESGVLFELVPRSEISTDE